MAIINPIVSESSLVLHPKEKKEMLSIRTEGKKTLARINSSSIGVIQECLRKTKYSLYDGWRNENEFAATLFGRSIHKALEVFYAGDIERRIIPPLEELLLIAYGKGKNKEGLIEQAISAFVCSAEPLSSLPDRDKRSVLNGIWILHEYFKSFKDDPYIAYRDAQGYFLERTFTYRFHEDEDLIIDVFGTIDFAFLNKKTGNILPGDHKTTSFLGFQDQSYFDREKPNHQYTLYCLAMKEVFGLPFEEFLVNVIEVKSRPVRETSRGISFPRQITKRNVEDFDELREVILDSVDRYLFASKKDQWPLGGVDACNKYGGCQFKQICASPKSIRETVLKNKFVR